MFKLDKLFCFLTLTKFWKGLCIIDCITFWEKNYPMFSFRFEFRQKYSTIHALIPLADKRRHETYKDYDACGIFMHLQKAFDVVDHHIVLWKSVLNSVDLVPSWMSWVSCHRPIVPAWVRNFFSWVFCGSKISSRGYFVGPKFFLVGISWSEIFFREYFVGLHFFRGFFVCTRFFLVCISRAQDFFL